MQQRQMPGGRRNWGCACREYVETDRVELVDDSLGPDCECVCECAYLHGVASGEGDESMTQQRVCRHCGRPIVLTTWDGWHHSDGKEWCYNGSNPDGTPPKAEPVPDKL